MKENFDDILRRRLEERDFPVDPKHREEMARLLDRNKKKRGFVFWWFGGTALLLIAGIWWFSHTNTMSNTDGQISSRASGESQIVEKASKDSSMPNTEEVKDEIQLSELKNAVHSNTREEKSHASEKSLNLRSVESPVVDDIKPISTPHSENKKSKQKSSNTSPSDNHTTTRQSETPGEKSFTLTETPVNSESIPEKVDDDPKDTYFKVELENPNEVRILSNTASIHVFPDSIEYDPWTNAIYHNGTVRSLNVTKPVSSLEVDRIVWDNDNAPGKIIPVTRNNHPVYFLVETGLGMVLASRPFYDAGIKLNIGGGLGMRLNPKLHLQLTGGYLMQNGGFDFERTSVVNTPDFGVRSEFNTLKPERLHFVYSKLGLAYRFNRSSLSAHVGAQYLYGAEGTITVVHHNQIAFSNEAVTTRGWLKTDGLNPLQWSSDIAYGYMVLPKLYIQGGVSMYYSSLTEEDPALSNEGYYWNGKTAKLQPFITLNYIFHGKL